MLVTGSRRGIRSGFKPYEPRFGGVHFFKTKKTVLTTAIDAAAVEPSLAPRDAPNQERRAMLAFAAKAAPTCAMESLSALKRHGRLATR